MKIEILYEDNHCLAVNKPAGLLSQGDETGDPSLVSWARDYLKERYRKPGNVYVGLVHRLDRPTSGVVVLARTSKAAGRLADQFRRGTIMKVYWALVEGQPEEPEGLWIDVLEKDRTRNRVRVVDDPRQEGLPARVEYRVLERGRGLHEAGVASRDRPESSVAGPARGTRAAHHRRPQVRGGDGSRRRRTAIAGSRCTPARFASRIQPGGKCSRSSLRCRQTGPGPCQDQRDDRPAPVGQRKGEPGEQHGPEGAPGGRIGGAGGRREGRSGESLRRRGRGTVRELGGISSRGARRCFRGPWRPGSPWASGPDRPGSRRCLPVPRRGGGSRLGRGPVRLLRTCRDSRLRLRDFRELGTRGFQPLQVSSSRRASIRSWTVPAPRPRGARSVCRPDRR